jgi:hypothetical protein
MDYVNQAESSEQTQDQQKTKEKPFAIHFSGFARVAKKRAPYGPK